MKLAEWAVVHTKYKDAFSHRLKNIEEKDDRILLTYTDENVSLIPLEQLHIPHVEGKTVLVTLQTKENIRRLLDGWDEYAKHDTLTITFANPQRNEQWSLKPALHNRVAPENIEQAIWSVASAVTFV